MSDEIFLGLGLYMMEVCWRLGRGFSSGAGVGGGDGGFDISDEGEVNEWKEVWLLLPVLIEDEDDLVALLWLSLERLARGASQMALRRFSSEALRLFFPNIFVLCLESRKSRHVQKTQ
jgi:hypothetical protein